MYINVLYLFFFFKKNAYFVGKKAKGQYGFEISYMTSGKVSAENALKGWKRSKAHSDIIFSRGIWKKIGLSKMGCFYKNHFANCWFAQ